ncbi:MAG: hypothetical protein Q9221_005685 [Calogaya cf. arnoldii]
MSESILEMEHGLRSNQELAMKNLQSIAKSTWSPCAVDEFFHVQQANSYLQGRFFEWHSKITTPPGLYVLSLLYLSWKSRIYSVGKVTAAHLRLTNVFAAFGFPFICKCLLEGLVTEYVGLPILDRDLPYLWSLAEINHAVLNICLFPPLFFFFGLYYTDVWSALSVLITIQLHQKRATTSMVVAGILSLLFRQTNIFWVAVYLGALKITRQLRRGRVDVERFRSLSWRTVVIGSWQTRCIYDPFVAQALFEDYVATAVSIVAASVGAFRRLLPHLYPYILMLGCFGFFVLWNGGVVLGDKENHVASLHLAQMLYLWPYIMFFSFPLLYPYFLSAVIPQDYTPSPIRMGSTRHQIPRLRVAIPIMAVMLAVVHFNTIVHSFALADNRHYTFYVFRILLRHPANKYLAVPIYFCAAWAAITAFGGLPNVQTPTNKVPANTGAPLRESPPESDRRQRLPPSSNSSVDDRGHHVSAVLAWLLATTLSLVTAPLVEPRYFIVPWLVWRLHVASPLPTGGEAHKKRKQKIRTFKARCEAVFYGQHDHRLWLETVWFLVVNWAVCHIFLYWGFKWPQEEGNVQRFMW